MRRILILILILLKTCIAFTQECSPTFRDVFDFNVGDFFKYHSAYYSPPGLFLHGSSSYLTESYVIIGKFVKGDTLFYARKGISRLIVIETSYDPDHPIPADTLDQLIYDTLQFIDSPSHFLNKCNGNLINMKEITIKDWYAFGSDSLQDASYYTSVGIEQNDSMFIKRVGDENNFYLIDSAGFITDTSQWLPWSDDYRPYLHGPLKFGVVHASGLGLTNSYWSNSEYSSDYRLVDYLKKSDSIEFPRAEIINGSLVKICQGEKKVIRAYMDSSFTYQWIKNGGIIIPGATNDTLEVSDSGSYQVFVTKGRYELNFSAPCVIKVHQLAISRENNDATISAGTTLTLSPIIRYIGDNELTWSWDADPTLNELDIKNPQASPDSNHIYKFSVTDGVCEDTASYKVNVTYSVLRVKNPTMPDMFFYPNPVTDKLFIKNANSSDVWIEIFDLYGRQVFNNEINSGIIDISYLSKGIYAIKLFHSGKMMTGKFIKE